MLKKEIKSHSIICQKSDKVIVQRLSSLGYLGRVSRGGGGGLVVMEHHHDEKPVATSEVPDDPVQRVRAEDRG